MTDDVATYLDGLGAPDILIERIELLLGSYNTLLPEGVQTLFISEYRDEDDQATFESLWLFSESFAMQANLLGTEEDQFDFVPYRHQVRHILVHKKNFDLVNPTPASRLSLEVWFADQRYGILKASGDNCIVLTRVLSKHLLPNAFTPANREKATSPS